MAYNEPTTPKGNKMENIETPNNTEESNSSVLSFVGGAIITLAGVGCVKAYGKMRDWNTARKLNKLAEIQNTPPA